MALSFEPQTTQSPTAPTTLAQSATTGAGKLSFRQKTAWGVGGFFENYMANAVGSMALPIYNIALGVDPAKMGIVLSIPRAIDAIIDPFLGNISDNTRTRWGRRRPSIFIGAVLSVLSVVFVFSPSLRWSTSTLLLFFLGLSILYNISFGVFGISYNALGLELTEDYHERTRVWAYRFFFIALSGLLVSSIYKLSFNRFFTGPGPYPHGHPEIIGARHFFLYSGLLVLLTGLVPAIFCREKAAGQTQPHINLFSAVKLTFRNRAYLVFIITITISTFGIMVITPMDVYMLNYHVGAGSSAIGANLLFWKGVTGTVCGFAFIPVVTWLATRLGKRNTMFFGQVMTIAGSLGCWMLYNPQRPWLVYLSPLPGSLGLSCIFILYGSMLGEICDVDELENGLRREGMYGAVSAFIGKVSAASTATVTGFVVKWTGFDAALASQSAAAIFRLRVAFVLIPSIMLAIAAVLIWRFPITEQRAREVRAQLDARKI